MQRVKKDGILYEEENGLYKQTDYKYKFKTKFKVKITSFCTKRPRSVQVVKRFNK